ncbi:unnamed protein product [Protopolystoma xenopodis]|uniref:Uncharacterized protein n=1 Tax=Protopolystoma xenopodis TaxID=117903 RepID=A0A448XC30_9PLAT|nr:unnamed protein product [Protopolystoma xenopodis]
MRHLSWRPRICQEDYFDKRKQVWIDVLLGRSWSVKPCNGLTRLGESVFGIAQDGCIAHFYCCLTSSFYLFSLYSSSSGSASSVPLRRLIQRADHECLVHELHTHMHQLRLAREEVELMRQQFGELQAALQDAQLIITEQQDQLNEYRRRVAQSQHDAEEYKVKQTAACGSHVAWPRAGRR